MPEKKITPSNINGNMVDIAKTEEKRDQNSSTGVRLADSEKQSQAETFFKNQPTLQSAIANFMTENGYDPKTSQNEKDKEKALVNAKRKAGVLMDSFRLLSDMFTTAGKGRVFERDSKDLYDKLDKEDDDIDDKYDTNKKAYVQAILEALKYDKNYRDDIMKELMLEKYSDTFSESSQSSYKDKKTYDAEQAQAKADLAHTQASTAKLNQNISIGNKENNDSLVIGIPGTKTYYTIKDKAKAADIYRTALSIGLSDKVPVEVQDKVKETLGRYGIKTQENIEEVFGDSNENKTFNNKNNSEIKDEILKILIQEEISQMLTYIKGYGEPGEANEVFASTKTSPQYTKVTMTKEQLETLKNGGKIKVEGF